MAATDRRRSEEEEFIQVGDEDDSGESGSDGDEGVGEDSESDGVLAEDGEQRWLIQNGRARVRARGAWVIRLIDLEEVLQELLLADEVTLTRQRERVLPLLPPIMAELGRMQSEAVGFFRGLPEDAAGVRSMLDGVGKVRELIMRVVDRIELEPMQGVTGTPDCYEEERIEEDQEQEEGGSSEGEGEDQEQDDGGGSEGEGEDPGEAGGGWKFRRERVRIREQEEGGGSEGRG